MCQVRAAGHGAAAAAQEGTSLIWLVLVPFHDA